MRECGCPEYVETCAHFEGRAVWLLSPVTLNDYFDRLGWSVGQPCPGCGHVRKGLAKTWQVAGPGIVDEPHCDCAMALTIPIESRDRPQWLSHGYVATRNARFRHKSHGAALAAFHEAEQQLLRGEA